MARDSFVSWPILLFVATALLSGLLVGMATVYARRAGVLALPGPRGSHRDPTPSGGGIGLVTALLLIALWPDWTPGFPSAWLTGVLPGLALLSVTGWWDDRSSLGVTARLAVQVAVSLWLLAYLQVGWSGGWNQAFWWLAAMVFLMGMMNAWNFMDGSNGMAGSQCLFSGLVLAGLFGHAHRPDLAAAALALAGASAGFLPWNLPRARVFMGDAGSVPTGFAVAALLVIGCREQALSPATALLLPAVFVIDSGMTLASRILRGERWYTAHRQHVYQRLMLRGWSHVQVLSLYQAINLFLVLPGVVMGAVHSGAAWLITGILILAMILTWLSTSLKLGEYT